MIEFHTQATKEKFKANVGTGSWFSQLEQASNLFHIDERVTWVDIEGIPIKLWTKNTFNRIASKWGVLLHVDDQDESCFHSKRICIKTKLVENIFESFKIISNGKVFWVRAKEASGWSPDFVDDEVEDSDSDGEIREDGLHDENVDKQEYADADGENDAEKVSETIFEKDFSQAHKKDDCNIGQNVTRSEDPFNIYDLLNKKQDNIKEGICSNDTMKYPPGFTPTVTDDAQSDDFKEVEKEGDEALQNIQDEKEDY